MPIQNVTIDPTQRLGNQLYNLVASIRDNISSLNEYKNMMDNMSDVGSFLELETRFGVAAGKGETIYNLMAGSVSELESNINLSQLVDWLNPLD